MVQSCRMDPVGDGPLLCPDSRLWGSTGFGSGPVLEALRMALVQSLTSVVSGHFVHGAVPHEPPATPASTPGPLLRLFLVEASAGASAGHDAGSWSYLPSHPQKETVMDTTVLEGGGFSFNTLLYFFHGYCCDRRSPFTAYCVLFLHVQVRELRPHVLVL